MGAHLTSRLLTIDSFLSDAREAPILNHTGGSRTLLGGLADSRNPHELR